MKETKTLKNISKTPAVMILAVVMLVGLLYSPGKSLISGLTQPVMAETTKENYANREMPSTEKVPFEWDDDEEETQPELSFQDIDNTKKVKVLLGDVDGNGKVEASDARLALRCSVDLVRIWKNTYEFKRADYTQDNQILAEDARMILRAAVGLEELKYIEVGGKTEEPISEEKPTDPPKQEDATIDPNFTEEPTFSRFIGYDTEGNPHFEYVDYTKVCRYCGRTDCISLKIEYDENDCLIDHRFDCPEYDAKKNPGVYCQICGRKTGDGTNGTCVWYIIDMNCPVCGEFVHAHTCHTCKGH